MSWNPDKPPIEYLERRIRYYKKRIPVIKKFVNRKRLIQQYGKKLLKEIINSRVLHTQQRITEFEEAVKILHNYKKRHEKRRSTNS